MIFDWVVHSFLWHKQAFEKGFKPKGTIFPCGYEVNADMDETMAERIKNLAKLMSKTYFINIYVFLLLYSHHNGDWTHLIELYVLDCYNKYW